MSDRSPSRSRWWRRGLGAVAALVAAGAILFAGFEIAHRQFPPYSLMDRVDAKIEWIFFRGEPGQRRLEDIAATTALIRIEGRVGVVETGRDPEVGPLRQNGGGLTSFGEDVLLLPYDGRIYAASGPEDIRDTGLAAPDNNRAAYQALAEDPEFAEYEFNPDYLRYNDLEYVRDGDDHGLVASYTEYHPDEVCYTNTLARLDFAPGVTSIDEVEAGPDDWEVIYRTSPCLPFKSRYLAMEGHMASGRLAYDEGESTLYLSSGDFHLDGMRSEPPVIAQEPDAEYGRIMAMSPDGSDVRMVDMGHRNVQGMVLGSDGRLFVAEHGPQGGDEVNIIREGANYGWPRESYGLTYSSTPIPESVSFGRHETFEPPIHAWVPSVATSGIAMLEEFHPAWNGDLLVASLIDRSLYRIRLEGDRAVYSERIEIGQRVRDVHQHTDGRLVLWTDNEELIFMSAEDLPDRALTVERYVRFADLGGSTASRLETALSNCAQCHSFQIDENEKAPSLARIHGDAIASSDYEGYSDALKSKGGDWTDENLTAYLTDPQSFAPGTSMGAVEDPDLVEHVVGYLKELDRQF